MSHTLYDKLWRDHLVTSYDDGSALVYIDRHLIHEVTSPQAFSGLRHAGRAPWRINANVAVADHNVPTTNRASGLQGVTDTIALQQLEALDRNCQQFGITEYDMLHPNQGIVHVIGPELGLTLPGMTLVCGDSHTSTHGALATLSQGIGTSDVEHVLATQCLRQKKSANMLVRFDGTLPEGVSAKDMVLAMIGTIGTAGATGHAIEYAGSTIAQLDMEQRMTLCNMSIEAGARYGMVAFDDITLAYVSATDHAPRGEQLERAIDYWRTLVSDEGAVFDQTISIDVSTLAPQVSWGTSPEMVIAIDQPIPDPDAMHNESTRTSYHKALDYMNLQPGQSLSSIPLDRIFIGSCTNSRISDLRAAAKYVKGRTVASNIKQALVVAGSGAVKRQAESEGLDTIFIESGFEWRDPGCSMCLAMNPDKLNAGEHCAATSNRNFEGRQGTGGRTHLVSPAMAAAAAIAGHFVDIRQQQVL